MLVAIAFCQAISVTPPALMRKTMENTNVDADTIDGTAPIQPAAAKQSATNTRLDRRTDGAIRRVNKCSFRSDISIRDELAPRTKTLTLVRAGG